LKLNLVGAGRFAKTITMGKEIFDCYDEQSRLVEIKDVETFVESVDLSRPGRKTHVDTTAKSVDVVTCTDRLPTGTVSCSTRPMPLGFTKTPLAKCSQVKGGSPAAAVEQPAEPFDMASALVAGKLIETVKVELQVFSCSGGLADVYVFTQRLEGAGGSTSRTVASRYAGVVCIKDEATATVAQCKLFDP
jgi:hypothetical protein